MKITSSTVDMSSSRDYSKTIQRKQSVFKWTLDGKQHQVSNYSSKLSYKEHQSFDFSQNGYFNYNKLGQTLADVDSSKVSANMPTNSDSTDSFHSRIQQTFHNILEMLEKARFKSMFDDSSYLEQWSNDSTASSVLNLTSSATPQVWNRLEVNSYFTEEKETTAFASTGTAITADGKSISFDVTMEMSRSFTESCEFSSFSTYEQILTDPLVINLDSNPTSISDQKFYFDLDADGIKEEISQLNSGSGYLALDKNGDGIINNGSELFGPSTGNGFDELSSYDTDHNGWIDESDEIYNMLKVWTKDKNGNDKLLSLKDADVGAIYLGNSKTEFSLTDDKNNIHGQVRSTGIYLKESGGSGTVQQVDF